MGSPVDLSAWTARETDALAAFEEVFNEFDRLDSLLSVWKRGQRRPAFERHRRAGPGDHQPRHDRRAAARAAGQRVDRGQVRRHLRRAVRRVEVRSRSGRPHPDPSRNRRPAAVCGLPRPSSSTRPRARRSWQALACACTWAAWAKGTPWIARAAILRSRGVTDFMVQSGGDLYVGGRRGDLPVAARRFAILAVRPTAFRHARAVRRHLQHVGRLRALLHARTASAITTSWTPTLGQPARGARSVTIVAPHGHRGRRAVDRRLRVGSRSRHGDHRTPARRRRRDRHLEERSPDLIRPAVEVAPSRAAHGRALTVRSG